ncbi:MAG TPA: zinc ribbon domain-containing protein [Stellaceae bacterium]|nr:zinc ribbon domain-containing protein [Stellaceae bacterium]
MNEDRHFWEGCDEGELRYQLCTACGDVQFPPRPFCRHCGGRPRWAVSGARGCVYALTSVARAPSAEFAALAPYDILLVDLDEGFRMMAHGGAALGIGDRVRLTFRVLGGRSLPYFLKDH